MNIRDQDVAIIGMAGKFPGADSVSELWDNLCSGREGLRTFSDEVLLRAGVGADELADPFYVKVAAPLNGVEHFDPGFFRISPLEAELMDPQVRLLLQCAWETLEDAGYAGKGPQRIGVFAGAGGITTSYFANFANLSERFDKLTAGATHLGNDKDFLATSISYRLNLTGPSMTVQTACSTSLVALHQARMSVLNGECEMALAGGVSVRVPHGQGYQYKEGFIFSRTGRVGAFDAAADGVVFGSGLGLVLIKRLAHAVRDDDHIYAVIKGSAIGNDGKGKMSYAASSAKGQIACIRAALGNAGVDAGSIGFVEAHGTGTALGDPEEVKALSAAFREDTERCGYCVLGAVKSNLGHLEAAAGIAGLIKAALVVRHGVIPPALHYATPNPRIRFDSTPFRIEGKPINWSQGTTRRRAGVNSLGVGGTNVFVVLEQYPQPQRANPAKRLDRPVVVPLSARTETSLHAYAARLGAFLENAGAALDLADLAYTLQTGREAFQYRAAFVAASIAQLRAALRAFVEHSEIAAADGVTGALASAWMAGDVVDWSEPSDSARPRRVSLPTYVFDTQRCWIDAPPATPASTLLHPLLHANTSDLREHRYSSLLGGDEFFLKDHRLRITHDDQHDEAVCKVLPGVACLEMARAAFERAAHAEAAGRVVALRDIVWMQRIEVRAPTRVDIALLAEDESVAFEIFGADQTVYCQGRAGWSDALPDVPLQLPFEPPHEPPPARLASAVAGWDAGRVYEAFASMGLHYGPAHRAIRTLWVDDREARAHLALPPSVQAGAGEFGLHPSLLDGALQTATALVADLTDPSGEPLVPFSLDAVYVRSACPVQLEVRARFAARGTAQGRLAKIDIDLYDLDGKLCVQLRGFAARPLDGAPREALLATEVWQAAPLHTSAPTVQSGARRVVLCGWPDDAPVGFAELGCAVTRLPLEGGDLAQRYTQFSLECCAILQSLLSGKLAARMLVQFVMPAMASESDAAGVPGMPAAGGADANRLFAGVAGLLKTAALENSHIAAQLIFVDGKTPGATLAACLAADANEPSDVLIDRSGGTRRVARWRLLDEPPNEQAWADAPYRAGGVYLITGGLGGLGALLARDIARRASAARIVIAGRAAAADAVAAGRLGELCADICALGGLAEYRQLRLENAQQVRSVIAGVVREHGQLNGIFHCAGMIGDAFLLKKSAVEFRAVLEPKVAGTLHLHEATHDVELDFMVLFSSLSAALGNPGQGDYATANGFMDQFAGYRNALAAAGQCRGRTVAIRWPLWRAGGMSPGAAGLAQLARTTGVRPLRSATGLRMLARSLCESSDQTLVMDGEPVAMRRALGLMTREPELPAAPATALVGTSGAAHAGPGSSLAARTEAYLCAQLGELLKLPAGSIDPHAPLENYGIDSIIALDLTQQLERVFGPLSKTLFFEYLSLSELAGYFVEAHAATLAALFAPAAASFASLTNGHAAASPVPAAAHRVANLRARRTQTAPARGAAGEPVAIIGLSGRYPGARTVESFWEVLREGRDCIVEVPQERWDWRDYYSEDRTQPGRHYSKWGGFIEGVDEFDARFFGISPREAATLDPQERLFLEHAWLAIEDAGYPRARLQIAHGTGLAGRVGVYAGVMYNEYQLLGAEASLRGRRIGFASNPASIANRVSYFLNLHGPSMVVDTMCSSSLSAIHVACQDLRLGRTAMALAGGVNVTLHPNKYLMLSAGQFIAGEGRCQSFGEGGDGYIPGEGVGIVVLKRLADAERDGDRIYAVIRGTGVSHGGKTNGYTVPNPHAQASAIRDALDDAGIDPRHVSYLEAHGTGTKLGDPIEIAALTRVFREHTDDRGFCLIGSAKSNIGHCEAAAGIAGLTKVLLQMRHRAIVPSLHSSALNPHIDFAASPFVVNQTLREWKAPVSNSRALPRIAGVSSFGAGGSNAHLIVEDYVAPAAVTVPDVLLPVPLSARTPEQLLQKARDLLTLLRAPGQPASLASIAYTLQVGREAMPERLGILANSLDSLRERLQAFVDGDGDGNGGGSGSGSGNGAPGAESDYGCPHDGPYRGRVPIGVVPLAVAEDIAPAPGAVMDASSPGRLLARWVEGAVPDWRGLYQVAPPLVSLPAYPFARQRHWFDGNVDAGLDAASVAAPMRHAGRAAAPMLHPLLQRNTSDFSEQRFVSSFDGDEFFFAGEPGARGLSAAAALEMARAAFEASLPARVAPNVLELTDIAWAQPGVAAARHTLAIALFDCQGDAARFEIHQTDVAEEIVHCQGQAAYAAAALLPQLDLAALRGRVGEPLVELQLAAGLADSQDDYVLHPALVADALLAAARLAGTQAQPVALAAARIALPYALPAFAWVRPAAGGTPADAVFDIDICDSEGGPCVQLRGLRYAPHTSASQMAPQTAPRQLPLPSTLRYAAAAPDARPGAIALAAPASFEAFAQVSGQLSGPLVALADPGAATPERVSEDPEAGQDSEPVKLFDHGGGVYAIRVERPELAARTIELILRALRAAEAAPDLKVLMLFGREVFLSGGRSEHDDALAQGLYRAIAAFPYPTVAVMRGDARGPGFLVGALCDFIVCAEAARYGFTMPEAQLFPHEVRALFDARFGRACTTALLYLEPLVTGSGLRQMGWHGPLLDADAVEAHAHALAAELARKPRGALQLLKRALGQTLLDAVEALQRPASGPAVVTSDAAGQAAFGDAVPDAAEVPAVHTLPATNETPMGSVLTQCRVRQEASGVLRVMLDAVDGAFDLCTLAAELRAVQTQLRAAAAPRCVVLTSRYEGFLPLQAMSGDAHAALALHDVLRGFAPALIAVLDRGASGLAWFAALGADACIHVEQGRYSADGLLDDARLACCAAAAFARHFDGCQAKRLLAGGEDMGAALRQALGAPLVVEREQAFARAEQLAAALAAWPADAIAALKCSEPAFVPDLDTDLNAAVAPEPLNDTPSQPSPAPVALESDVVTAFAHPDGVLEVRMIERGAKNMFSAALSRGLTQVFERVAANPAFKVVVLSGYEQYFSSGGTRETLLAIHAGEARFTDIPLFRLPLDCELPVIAAMQGHGIGAGWALGMFADLTLFGEASRYRSPYMDYGFTPGAGATLVFPHTLGHDLARESLLGAREYSGADLAARGLPNPVLTRDVVSDAALALASTLARADRPTLVALKRCWAFELRRQLDAALERELAMHAQTFVGQADVLARIEHGFGDAPASSGMLTAVAVASPARSASAAHEAGVPQADSQTHSQAIAQRLRALLAHELRMEEADIADDVQFVDLGLDSVTGVTWIRKINEAYGTSIEAIKVYSYPTLAALAGFVASQAAHAAPDPGMEVVAPAQRQTGTRAEDAGPAPAAVLNSWRRRSADRTAEPAAVRPEIAVIGMACRFAHAKTLDEFWSNLAAGRDCIDEVPAGRWDLARYYQPGEATPGKTYSKWLGMLDRHDCFDAGFFRISPREARAMDPQQRVFLEVCWHAIEHAGYAPKALAGSRCGVFAGCAAGDYHLLFPREQLSGPGFMGAAPSILAARIAYLLDLQGPSLAIDTACSSSLVAIASACDSLVAGTSDLALAGGVNVLSGPAMHIMTSQMGMLSPHGRCYTFDERADGIALGEGAGVVVLKRLADAQRDNDCIYGVVQGWGVNQDGKTNGITAPNADSQTRLQRQVYERFGIDPAGIGLVEAHGTGTALGDPVEVAALKASFAHYTQRANFCALSSVKSNIGHCLAAAGVSGFIKALLAIRHGQVPPAAHFRQINPHIGLQDSPFFVSDTLRAWPRDGTAPRRAAVNSFGFSGTNAHAVIAEYQGPPEPVAPTQDVLVPLSAGTSGQLVRKARDLLAFLSADELPASGLARVAYTLQVGREVMNERVAFVAASFDDLQAKLRVFIGRADTSSAAPEGVYRADAATHRDTLRVLGEDADFQTLVGKWIGQRALPKLADLWVKGLDLDWAGFHTHGTPQRIGLPLYPFAQERHWFEDEAALVGAAGSAAGPADLPASVAALAVQQQGAAAQTEPAAPARQSEYAQPTSAPSIGLLKQQLQSSLAQALLLQPADIDTNKPFIELGLDSIVGVEWVKALNRQYGLTLSATRIYDYPSVAVLAGFIAGQLGAPAASHERSDAGAHAEAAQPLAHPAQEPHVTARLLESGTPRTAFEFAFAFAPKHASPYRDLYFYSSHCDGDFDADGECTVRLRISPDSNVCLREHVVFGEHLFPADAFIELVCSAFRTYFDGPAARLEHIGIASPLVGVPGSDCHVKVVFRRSGAALQFFVRSSVAPNGADERLHMQGFITAQPDIPPQGPVQSGFAVERTLARAQILTNSGSCYAPLASLAFGATQATGEIQPVGEPSGFLVGPFALYGGLCTVINYAAYLSGVRFGVSSDAFLPYQIGAIAARRVLDGRAYHCHARLRMLEPNAAEFDFDIVDETGECVLTVESISLRRVAGPALRTQAAPRPGDDRNKVAVIGMACRYPQSPDTDALWRNLEQGVDCVGEIPAGRWPDDSDWFHPDTRHPGTSYSKWAGLLERIDTFDPLFFGISPAEAGLMDPQQRIFIEECWKAIENAGYAPGALSGSACGVYVGCSTGDYGRVLQREGQDKEGAAFMGTSSAILAARISYLLNLKGPAIALDTACSSSLLAVHLACESIRSGENTLALAGGVNLLATPAGHILTSQVGMPSPDGRCAPFDANANGIVFSEGCGVLVLKSLSQALADNDEILGVIDASGTNQDGKTNGMTAPSSAAQEQLLNQVYRRFGIDPCRIGYVEAHGTGTPLGDPIEAAALGAAFSAYGVATGQCALGSVKGNLGHTGFAAGVAGLIKVLLCIRHRKLVPSIHYRAPNPHIDFAASPFFVNTACREWDCDGARVAAVSSFGFSGTNAHVVVAEYVRADEPRPVHEPATAPPQQHALPLSARSEPQLRAQAAGLLAYLKDAAQPPDLSRVAYTLQVGRDGMAHRVAFAAASVAQLTGQLRAYLDGASREPGVYRGPSAPDADALGLFADDGMRRLLDEWLREHRLEKLLNLWVRGIDFDWKALHVGRAPRPLALPAYPFARERYWAGGAIGASEAGRIDGAGRLDGFARRGAALHPLLQQNTSDLDGQRYTSRFSGSESVLADHQVNGQPVLPAAAYLEMVRAALADALPGGFDGLCAQLRDVVWMRPLGAAAARNVSVALYDEDDGDDARIGFEVESVDEDGSATVHCHGHCFAGSLPDAQPLDLARLRERMSGERLDPSVLYPRFAALGLEYGPAYRGIVALHQGDGEALVELRVPTVNEALQGCVLHPGVVDGALQGTIALAMAGLGRSVLPFALEALDVVAPCTPEMAAWVRYADGAAPHGGALVKLDIDLCDRDGTLCARLRGFSARPMDGPAAYRDHGDGGDQGVMPILDRVLNNELSPGEAAELTRLTL